MRSLVCVGVLLAALEIGPSQGVEKADSGRAGSIVGRTVDALTRTPVGGVTLTLTGGPQGARGVRPSLLSRADGRFQFSGLPVGVYSVLASASGYLNSASGQFSALAAPGPVVLTAASSSATIEIGLWRAAVVSGTAVDRFGFPVVGIPVFVVRSDDRWLSTPEGLRSDLTDDRGRFRVGNLPPGDYVVCVIPRPYLEPPDSRGPRGLVVPMFYPATRIPSGAEVFSMQAGDTISDIVLTAEEAPEIGLSGKLIEESGPAAGILVRAVIALSDAGWASSIAEIARTRTNQQGVFTFRGLPHAEYVLLAARTLDDRSTRGGSAPGPLAWARTPAAIPLHENDEISMMMRPGLTVRGRVVFGNQGSGHGELPSSATVISLRPTGAARPFEISTDANAELGADGVFALGPLLPGRYSLRVVAGQGWELASVLQSGREMLGRRLLLADTDLEALHLVMARTRAEIRVTVIDDAQSRATGHSVAMFPVDATEWADATIEDRRFQRVALGASGTSTLIGMPPGKYFVVALRRSSPDMWQKVDSLRRLVLVAHEVTVGLGERRTITISLPRLP